MIDIVKKIFFILTIIIIIITPNLFTNSTKIKFGICISYLQHVKNSDSICWKLRSRSLHCVKTYKILLYMIIMHMILESLESDFKCALIPETVKLHVGNKPKNNTLQWHTLIINTFRGPVFTIKWRSLHFILDEVRSECEQTIVNSLFICVKKLVIMMICSWLVVHAIHLNWIRSRSSIRLVDTQHNLCY